MNGSDFLVIIIINNVIFTKHTPKFQATKLEQRLNS